MAALGYWLLRKLVYRSSSWQTTKLVQDMGYFSVNCAKDTKICNFKICFVRPVFNKIQLI
jgi:hypothetical protein